jgi:hypothetical protein
MKNKTLLTLLIIELILPSLFCVIEGITKNINNNQPTCPREENSLCQISDKTLNEEKTISNQKIENITILHTEPDQNSKILTILERMDNSIFDLGKKFDGMDKRLQGVEDRLESQEEYLKALKESQRNSFDYLNYTVKNLSSKMESIEEHVTGAKAFKESEKSMINLIRKGIITACGNLVLFINTVFVLTAKHAIYDEVKYCIKPRNIRHVQSNKAYKISQVFGHPIEDIALISILLNPKQLEILKEYAAIYSTESLRLSDQVTGLCNRKNNIIYEVGKIKEVFESKFLADMGGSSGQSGCGYFNSNSHLSSINLGAGEYTHSGFARIKKAFKKLSRNPRTRIGDVSSLFNLNFSQMVRLKKCPKY